MNPLKNEDTKIQCQECQAGHMHRELVTYFTWLGDELVTVPDFPAYVCDVCGRREYDRQAVNQLALMLTPNNNRSSARKRPVTQKSADKNIRPSRP